MTITTFLMFSGRAEEAMTFYLSVFDGSKLISIERYGPAGPGKEGSVQRAVIELGGQRLMCIDSPVQHAFTFTPAISLYVSGVKQSALEKMFAALSDRGEIFMPLQEYPFSKQFAWVQDRFGVSWQLNLS